MDGSRLNGSLAGRSAFDMEIKMTVGLERVPNDEARLQVGCTESISRTERAVSTGWSNALRRVRRVPTRIWTLLLVAIVVSLASEAYTVGGLAEQADSAKPMPLLLMMTEKPVRQTAP